MTASSTASMMKRFVGAGGDAWGSTQIARSVPRLALGRLLKEGCPTCQALHSPLALSGQSAPVPAFWRMLSLLRIHGVVKLPGFG